MMKIRIPKKHLAVALAALLMANGYQMQTLIAETVTETDTEIMTAAGESTETGTEESETESENLSSVTLVHTAEIEEDVYAPTNWWKADLTEYADNFSLVKYEAVDSLNETTFEITDENGEVIGTEEDAVLIAQGNKNDTVVSNGKADSAVSSVEEGYFAFTTYGYGHGVGLSQNGANFYAKYAGWDYQDILFHYYPGTTLMNTGTAEKEIVTVKGVPGNVLQQVAEIVHLEIGAHMHEEAIKAQAVAIYSYMKYHKNDAHDLKGKKNPPQKIIDACASVLGEALYYDGKYAMTMFYASSGGITANCYDVFVADIPYLRSVSADYDELYDPHYGDVIYYSVEELRRKLENAYGIKLSANPENWITIVEGNGGYVNKVIIDGKVTVRGNSFRAVMGFKSPKFTYICSTTDEIPPQMETTEPTESISTTTTSQTTKESTTTTTHTTTESNKKETTKKETTTTKETSATVKDTAATKQTSTTVKETTTTTKASTVETSAKTTEADVEISEQSADES